MHWALNLIPKQNLILIDFFTFQNFPSSVWWCTRNSTTVIKKTSSRKFSESLAKMKPVRLKFLSSFSKNIIAEEECYSRNKYFKLRARVRLGIAGCQSKTGVLKLHPYFYQTTLLVEFIVWYFLWSIRLFLIATMHFDRIKYKLHTVKKFNHKEYHQIW